ncbi:MAG: type II toxin-antitoxin system RelE/ParE family toxin [Patescibacteria group bacterium]
MRWRIEFSKTGERDLAALDRPVRREIIDRIEWLSENFDECGPLPLHGQWRGFFKLRVGDWRVAYTFDASKQLVSIRVIDHRSKIYKRSI